MANRIAGITNIAVPRQTREGKRCMIVLPDDLANKVNNRLAELFNTKTETFVNADVFTQRMAQAQGKARLELLPLLRRALSEGNLHVFSESEKTYIAPLTINGIDMTHVTIQTKPGVIRNFPIRYICGESDVLGTPCEQLMRSWGFQTTFIMNQLEIVTGQSSSVVVVAVKPEAYNEWLEVVGNNELPITFTYITPNGTYYYFYQYQGVEDLPTIIAGGLSLQTNGSWVLAPCSDEFEVVEGLDDDFPEIADMPDWLYDYFKQ